MNHTNQTKKLAIQDYLIGHSSVKVGKKYGCSDKTVRRWVKSERPNAIKKVGPYKLRAHEEMEIIELYRHYGSTDIVAEVVQKSSATIRNVLKRNEIKLKKRGRQYLSPSKKNRYIEISITYDNSPLSIKEVARNYEISIEKAKYAISAGRKYRKKDRKLAKVSKRNRYIEISMIYDNSSMTIKEIAKKYDISFEKARYAIKAGREYRRSHDTVYQGCSYETIM